MTVGMFSVQHDRSGPVAAPLCAGLPDGRRLVASAAAESLPPALSGGSLAGKTARIRPLASGMVYEPA